jgi:hypothetical protein
MEYYAVAVVALIWIVGRRLILLSYVGLCHVAMVGRFSGTKRVLRRQR